MKTLLAVMMLMAVPALADDTVTIKLGTLAPQGSSWHNLLKEMGEKFTEASGGKVKVKIYAGGTQGSEGDMVRKMGVGQLQAASITNVGMHDIIAEPMAFTAPGMVDDASFPAVFAPVEKKLEAMAEAKGYVVLHWAQVGAVRIFCTKPYKTPEEASADGKFFAWDGDPGSIEAFKLVGFRPVVLASVDIVPSLQTGMINCVAQAPAYVLTARLFDKANKMIDYPWTYLIGATLVKKDVWEKIPADLRPKLVAIARDMGKKVDAEVKKLNDDAITAMVKQGLEVVKVDPMPWQKAAEKSWPAVRGKVVPVEFFDEVVKSRDAAKKK
jgi:TRAP-type C4-dicarboxylate transport system substrate-binding protein